MTLVKTMKPPQTWRVFHLFKLKGGRLISQESSAWPDRVQLGHRATTPVEATATKPDRPSSGSRRPSASSHTKEGPRKTEKCDSRAARGPSKTAGKGVPLGLKQPLRGVEASQKLTSEVVAHIVHRFDPRISPGARPQRDTLRGSSNSPSKHGVRVRSPATPEWIH